MKLLFLALAAAGFGLAGFADSVEPVDGPIALYTTVSNSMQPTLAPGDLFVATGRKGECAGTAPVAGDVVIYRPPKNHDGVPVPHGNVVWVHRVVAGPGDRVSTQAGRLVLNGVPVPTEPGPGALQLDGYALDTTAEILPTGRRFLTVAGAEYGYVNNREELVVPAGHWFLMGDNRDNSLDSRMFGPIPQADICGTAIEIMASKTPGRKGQRP